MRRSDVSRGFSGPDPRSCLLGPRPQKARFSVVLLSDTRAEDWEPA
jgi:hypothetical protein